MESADAAGGLTGAAKEGEIDFETVISGAWLVSVLGAFSLALAEALRPPGRPVVRALLFLGLVLLFAALHFGALLLMLFINYCENCGGRPLTARDIAAGAVVLAPTAIVWIAVLLCRSRRRQNRGPPPPAA